MIETGLQHRQVLRIIRMLFQIAHAQVAAISDFPLIIPFFTGQDIEQGGFPVPFFAIRPMRCPSATPKDKSSKRTRSPKDFVRFSTCK